MRFIANGPQIPDELLSARDAGDVIFFCGAGVSQGEAKLPDFERLATDVIEILGSSQDSPARKLLARALSMEKIAGVGGLLATDRIFGLLEREFEVADVRAAVAQAIKPKAGYGLGAHRTLLDLATSRSGITRLVTTNFDLLFEEAMPALKAAGPPQLPDPASSRDFRGIIHLHGRVDSDYRKPMDDEFVVSSADFGRAYLSAGWATQFMRELLARFQVVFVGYSADDPPVQYLLEALNLQPGSANRLYAFQEGDSGPAAALWEHKGVQAIPFDSSGGFAPLWDTLNAWAARSRDVSGWYAGVLSAAAAGPAALEPHIRGQLVHIASTSEGTSRLVMAEAPLDGSWLLSFDPLQRYRKPDLIDPYAEGSGRFDPFEMLALDTDEPPERPAKDDFHKSVEIPKSAIDVFASNRFDAPALVQEAQSKSLIRGLEAGKGADRSDRIVRLCVWIAQVAHQPVTLWWATQQLGLHPALREHIESEMLYKPGRFEPWIRRAWRLLFTSWDDARDRDMDCSRILARQNADGWTPSLVREWASLYRPQLRVRPAFAASHPLLWRGPVTEGVLSFDLDYTLPYERANIPDHLVDYAVAQFRENLALAASLDREIEGHDRPYVPTTRGSDGEPRIVTGGYEIAGLIAELQLLIERLAASDPDAAKAEILRWPTNDDDVFARLRIAAAGMKVLPPAEAGDILLSLSDTAFWASEHERDVLYTLRDRWPDFSLKTKRALERRLLKTYYPWGDDVRRGKSATAAYYRLSRLQWLSNEGVAFTFDLAARIAANRKLAPDWTPEAGGQAAADHSPRVSSIATDTSADAIADVPLDKLLEVAEAASRIDFTSRVEREPFRGLSASRPARALAALSHAARNGIVPVWAWRSFLYVENRKDDPIRLLRATAARLTMLPTASLYEIAHPVADWLEKVSARLKAEAPTTFAAIWNAIVTALAAGGGGEREDGGGGRDPINSPVGRLVTCLMADAGKRASTADTGLPSDWKERVTQLLNLPGMLRRQALQITGSSVVWLFYSDPAWTEQTLLPAVADFGLDGDAVWAGLLRNFGLSHALFQLVKPHLIARSTAPQTNPHHISAMAGGLLAGWGGSTELNEPERLVTDIELREVLICAKDEFRISLLGHLERWSSQVDGPWSHRLIPFLSGAWPKQRALHTPRISGRLADLAISAGDLMPAVVEAILPRLVPVRDGLRSLLYGQKPIEVARRFPVAMLDLLWAILGEDARLWPYRAGEIIDVLGEEGQTSADTRLSELRQRRDR